MDNNKLSTLAYHPLTMTINGVTKNVLVPLPKNACQGKPVTAKLPDGSRAIIPPNNAMRTATETRELPVFTSSLNPVATALLRTGYSASNQPLVLNASTQATRPVQIRTPGAANLPRLSKVMITSVMTSSNSKQVAVEAPSGKRQIVRIAMPTTAASFIRPVASHMPTRPVILRRNTQFQSPCVIVRPHIASPSVMSSANSVGKCLNSMSSTASASSLLTMLSSARTMTRREAIDAGWIASTGVDDDRIQPAPIYSPSAFISNHAASLSQHTPMDVDSVEPPDIKPVIDGQSSHCPSLESVVDDLLISTAAADKFDSVDNTITQMKVIEIRPENISDDEVEDIKPTVHVETACDPLLSMQLQPTDSGIRSSSVSTDTAISDSEFPTSASDDFVVLAEWTKDEVPVMEVEHRYAKPPRIRRKRRKRAKNRRRPAYKRPQNRSPSAVKTEKAKRTGGRPQTAQERYGIVDSFVSLARFKLKKDTVDVRNSWRYSCCRDKIQHCQCAWSNSTQSSTAEKKSSLTDSIRELLEPSLVTRGSTLPVHASGPTTQDGVTPLVVRQPDGKLSSVVAKRTTPGETSGDIPNKKKYLLIKSRTGSYLVPVDTLPDQVTSPTDTKELSTSTIKPVQQSTDTVKSAPAPCGKQKPATVSDTSGHRERIAQLKQQLRQQEQQLNSIRSQLSCNSIREHDLDATS